MADSEGDPGGKSGEPTLFSQLESSARSGEDRSNEDGHQWPPQDRFPLNLEHRERTVESTVQRGGLLGPAHCDADQLGDR
jgi:hypothetical protein